MKELEPKRKDRFDLTGQHAHLKQNKFLGSFRYQPGMKIYQLDTIKAVITEAEFETVTAGIDGHVQKTIVQKPNCIYLAALNKSNAERKFKQKLLLLLP